MTPEAGRVLRRIAYTLEVASMLGLLWIARRRAEPGGFAGPELSRWFSAGLALGISLWVVGTAAIYWPRRKTRGPE